MIALLPVTPQYICKAIHLQLLVLNTTQVFSIVSSEGQLIVHLDVWEICKPLVNKLNLDVASLISANLQSLMSQGETSH